MANPHVAFFVDKHHNGFRRTYNPTDHDVARDDVMTPEIRDSQEYKDYLLAKAKEEAAKKAADAVKEVPADMMPTPEQLPPKEPAKDPYLEMGNGPGHKKLGK
jgi:hypothetical protein